MVDTMKSFSDRQERITPSACSLVIVKLQGSGWNGYPEKVFFRMTSAGMQPCSRSSAQSDRVSRQLLSRIRAGIPMAFSRGRVMRPCFLCWGSSLVPGSPRQPISSSMGIR